MKINLVRFVSGRIKMKGYKAGKMAVNNGYFKNRGQQWARSYNAKSLTTTTTTSCISTRISENSAQWSANFYGMFASRQLQSVQKRRPKVPLPSPPMSGPSTPTETKKPEASIPASQVPQQRGPITPINQAEIEAKAAGGETAFPLPAISPAQAQVLPIKNLAEDKVLIGAGMSFHLEGGKWLFS